MEILFIILSIWQKVGVAAAISLCGLFLVPMFMMDYENEVRFILKTYSKRIFIVWSILILGAVMPTIDTLWKVRIGLIKYEMASHENITQGVETLERIGKKLECKYLGCEE
jgi:hypothetical protein